MTQMQPLPRRVPNVSAEEWQARINLAAAHRIASALGWTQATHNHFTLRVPDSPRHFLIKPNDLMFEEVSASSLIKLDLDGAPVDESDNVNSAGFPIHGAVLAARPEVNAVAHIHTDAGMAISAHPDGLRFITQRALRLYGQLGSHGYSGHPEMEDWDELQRSLGQHKALILKHHGLLTCGDSLAEAISLMHCLHDACKTQLLLEAAVGRENVVVPDRDVLERAGPRNAAYGRENALHEWPALVRWAERLDPSYRD